MDGRLSPFFLRWLPSRWISSLLVSGRVRLPSRRPVKPPNLFRTHGLQDFGDVLLHHLSHMCWRKRGSFKRWEKNCGSLMFHDVLMRQILIHISSYFIISAGLKKNKMSPSPILKAGLPLSFLVRIEKCTDDTFLFWSYSSLI